MQIVRNSLLIGALSLLFSLQTSHAQTSAAPATLNVGNGVAAQYEDGPPLGSLRLVPGEVVYFSFTAENFRKSDSGRVELTGHVQVFDPAGTSVFPVEE